MSDSGTRRIRTIIGVVIALLALTWKPAWSADEPAKSMTVVNYETGWIHDANGYHPAVFMIIENTSGRDLSGRAIRFQARFTDLQTAEVSIGRTEIRREFKPHQQINVPLEGTQAYELPFEIHLWPNIESKVMARVGNVGDEGTETLVIGKVQSVTRTAEEAFQALNQATSYHQRPAAQHELAQPRHHHASQHKLSEGEPRRHVDEKPLVATAKKIGAASSPSHSQARPGGHEGNALALLSTKALPGLGDDFYNFEQQFGMPVSIDAKRPEWTWAKYKHAGSNTEIITGSRERTGKVDVILMKVPKAQPGEQVALVTAGKALAGKLKSASPSSPTKSVRYLPSGRLEVVTASASSYKIVCMSPSGEETESCSFLVATRLPQADLEQLLTTWAQKSTILKGLKFLDPREGHQ